MLMALILRISWFVFRFQHQITQTQLLCVSALVVTNTWNQFINHMLYEQESKYGESEGLKKHMLHLEYNTLKITG